MNKKIGVYQIRYTVKNKRYIGSSVNILKRFNEHRRKLRADTHHCLPLQSAWNKYGEASFVFEILHTVSDIEQARTIEQQYLDREFSSLYNVEKKVNSRTYADYCDTKEDVRKKLSEINKGKKNPGAGKARTKAEKENLSIKNKGKNNPRYGVIPDLSYRKKMSDIKKGNPSKTRVSIKNKIYDSFTEAAKDLKLTPATVSYRVKSENFSDYRYA